MGHGKWWLSAALLAGCATATQAPPAHPVDAMRKVIDSLASEVEARLATDGYRGLPVVVRSTTGSDAGVEPIVVELLRTRLVEARVAVDAACAGRCMEVTLHEFTAESAKGFSLTPGQVLTFAGGNIPVVGSLVRGIGEQAREQERAARRATGFIVTFAAREANRYTARANAVIISSSNESTVASETK
jgi:hypothetical protein